MNVPKTIFREYDIRGTYPNELTEEVSRHIGCAVGTLLCSKTGKRSPKVVVGRDTRESSEGLTNEFIKGLVASGCEVVDVGVSLTPIIHFLTCEADFDMGVEVTASHNPANFNGFRLDYRNAVPIFGDDIAKLYSLVISEKYREGAGSVSKQDLFDFYLQYLKKVFKFSGSKKVVIDCGYGTISYFAERIFKTLGADVVPVFCIPKNTFPQGIPDPTRLDFITELEKAVLEHNAAVGFAFDEDSDRFGVVDEKGHAHDNDRILLLMAKEVLKTNPGGTIIFDVKSSNILPKFIKAWGGKPEMLRTGHPFFVKRMQEGALLGGEFSGHTFFADGYYGYDDGIYAACKVLEILEKSSKPLSELMSEFPDLSDTGELKIICPDDKKFEVVAEIQAALVQKKADFLDVITLDGIRVSVTETDWFLIRASNTSPYLSIRVQAHTAESLSLLKAGIRDLLSKYSYLNLSALN